MKQVNKLTLAGELVKVANTHELGVDFLTEIRRRKADLGEITIAKEMKKKQKCFDIIDDYNKLLKDKDDSQTWTISDFKVALNALKRESDGAIPGKK